MSQDPQDELVRQQLKLVKQSVSTDRAMGCLMWLMVIGMGVPILGGLILAAWFLIAVYTR